MRRSLTGRLHSAEGVTAYVSTIARNVARDLIRARRAQKRARDAAETLSTGVVEIPGFGWPAVATKPSLAVERCLVRLPAPLRMLYELRFERGMTQMRAARVMECSRQNVRTLEARLRDRVRAAVGHEGDGASDGAPPG